MLFKSASLEYEVMSIIDVLQCRTGRLLCVRSCVRGEREPELNFFVQLVAGLKRSEEEILFTEDKRVYCVKTAVLGLREPS